MRSTRTVGVAACVVSLGLLVARAPLVALPVEGATQIFDNARVTLYLADGASRQPRPTVRWSTTRTTLAAAPLARVILGLVLQQGGLVLTSRRSSCRRILAVRAVRCEGATPGAAAVSAERAAAAEV